ncbi:hypothetical protein [Streptomyces roseolus]|uniref:hypothetical protein n=1 Tax=Streptomyces roseolus TaxID=67358 RepID=UPI003664EF72
MAKYRINITGHASGSLTVETDETDPERIFEEAMSDPGAPTICAQCSGWGRNYSLEIGDEWEPEMNENGEAVVSKVED